MKGLQVDLAFSGAHSDHEPQIIEFAKTANTEENTVKDSEAVAFSKKIIEALGDKARKHNAENPREVSVSQLRNVYKGGVQNETTKDKTVNQLAMARVNMFLKMVGEGKIKDAFKRADVIKSYGSIDVCSHFEPSDEDYILADKDIELYGLNDYIFDNVDELYLETDEELRAEASAWLESVID
jgi:hypothetical protein